MGRPPGSTTAATTGNKRGRPPKKLQQQQQFSSDDNTVQNGTSTTNNNKNGGKSSTNMTTTTTTPNNNIRAACYVRRGSSVQIPSLTSPVAKPTNTNSISNTTRADTNAPTNQQYPRRYPRISGYYQIASLPDVIVGKQQQQEDDVNNADTDNNMNVYQNSRPKPIPMSNEVPFRSQDEIQLNRLVNYDCVVGEDRSGSFNRQQQISSQSYQPKPTPTAAPVLSSTCTDVTRTQPISRTFDQLTNHNKRIKSNSYLPQARNSNTTNATSSDTTTILNDTSLNNVQKTQRNPSNFELSQTNAAATLDLSQEQNSVQSQSTVHVEGRKRKLLFGEESSNVNPYPTAELSKCCPVDDGVIEQYSCPHDAWKQQMLQWYSEFIVAREAIRNISTSTSSFNQPRGSKSTANANTNLPALPPLPLLINQSTVKSFARNYEERKDGKSNDLEKELLNPNERKKIRRDVLSPDSMSGLAGSFQMQQQTESNATTQSTSFDFLLELNRGWASRSILYRGKVVSAGKLRSIHSITNDTTFNDNHWRRPAQSAIPLRGDYRTEHYRGIRNYDIVSTVAEEEDASTSDSESDESNAINDNFELLSQNEQQDLMDVWRAVQECAVTLKQRIIQKSSRGKLKSIHLSSVVHFLHHVAQLTPLPTTTTPKPRPYQMKASAPRKSTEVSTIKNIFDTDTESDSEYDEGNSVEYPSRENIDQLLQFLHETCMQTRGLFAKLLDFWGSAVGVDIDALHRLLKSSERQSLLAFDFSDEMHRQVDVAVIWQNQLDMIVKEQETLEIGNLCHVESTSIRKHYDNTQQQDDLAVLIDLQRRGTLLGFRSKAMTILEAKIQKGQQLLERITSWRESSNARTNPSATDFSAALAGDKKENMKFITAMVRETNRVKLRFPEVSHLLQFHQKAEAWVDRANIAIRSRISLEEIKSLIETGTADLIPFVDLSEYMEKLTSRVDMAEEWIQSFRRIVFYEQSTLDDKSETGSREGEDKEDDEITVIYDEPDLTMLEKMNQIRTKLDDKDFNSSLHELASEGSRIPVEVEHMKWLQLELDARGWSSKAKKWLPTVNNLSVPGRRDSSDLVVAESTSNKRVGKLDEIRDHLSKVSGFRDRLQGITSMTNDDRQKWVPDMENELHDLVHSADLWLNEHQSFFDIDGRKNDVRSAISLSKLRSIVAVGSAINANIGAPLSKIVRILNQAESWYKSYECILRRCDVVTGCSKSNEAQDYCVDDKTIKVGINRIVDEQFHDNIKITLKDMKNAIDAAYSDVAVDLDEASELQKIYNKIEEWQQRAWKILGDPYKNGSSAGANGKKSKGRPVRRILVPECTIGDMTDLIQEAMLFPIDENEPLAEIHRQLDAVRAWQQSATECFDKIKVGFLQLRQSLRDVHGEPQDFIRQRYSPTMLVRLCPDIKSFESSMQNTDSIVSNYTGDNFEKLVMPAAVGNEKDKVIDLSITDITRSIPILLNDRKESLAKTFKHLQVLVKAFTIQTEKNYIVTPERSVALELNAVMKWCTQSLKSIEKQIDVFDKRFFVDFDRFLHEGEELAKSASDPRSIEQCDSAESNECVKNLRSEWAGIVNDQLQRLVKLAADRKGFTALCSKIEVHLSEDCKKLTMDKLKDLINKCDEYPSVCHAFEEFRSIHTNVVQWVEKCKNMLDASNGGKKPSLDEARELLDIGERLLVKSNELRLLRHGVKTAKAWLVRFKKVDLNVSGCTNVKDARELLDECEELMVAVPEETVKLQQLSKNYCLCRRPYEGFMIACDTCDEWFHGPCVGVNEAKADKVSKYICVRCSLSKTFKTSCSAMVEVIRKWTATKGLKKARRVESQKHQRKVKKEMKEIERHRIVTQVLQQRLTEMDTKPGLAILGTNVENSVISSEAVATQVNAPVELATTNDPNECNEKDDFAILPNMSREDILSKIHELECLIEKGVAKLESLSQAGIERKHVEHVENLSSEMLRRWCIRVRSMVLVPSDEVRGQKSRPNCDGSLPEGMTTVIHDAQQMGIENAEDVKAVINAMKCVCWSFRSSFVLRSQAPVSEIKILLDESESLELPDEKALKFIKSLYQRSVLWESKVRKAMFPIPGEIKPFNLDQLNELSVAGDDIPLRMPMEHRLLTVIDDMGSRHCLCGGPSDGRFMIACEHCDGWFHGHCVGVPRHTSEADLIGWKCPICVGTFTPPQYSALQVDNFYDLFEVENEMNNEIFVRDEGNSNFDSSSDKHFAWPPYGLIGSEKASEILGEECLSMPDDNERLPYNTFITSSDMITPHIKLQKEVPPVLQSSCHGVVAPTLATFSTASAAQHQENANQCVATNISKCYSNGLFTSAAAVSRTLEPSHETQFQSTPCLIDTIEPTVDSVNVISTELTSSYPMRNVSPHPSLLTSKPSIEIVGEGSACIS